MIYISNSLGNLKTSCYFNMDFEKQKELIQENNWNVQKQFIRSKGGPK